MSSRDRWLFTIGLLALAYTSAAKLGIDLPVAHGVVTPVWIPTGLSVAAIVLLGPRVWPAIAIGAVAANATSGVGPAVAAFIAVGNTAEAVVAGYLLRRVDFRPSLARGRDVFALLFLGALIAPAVSATNGIATLVAAGFLAAERIGSEWMLWWFGDAMGVVLVAPFLLVWGDFVRSGKRPRGLLEAVLILALLLTVSSWVFLGGSWQYPYLIFPLLIWAALRFKQLGATTAILVVGGIAVWGTLQGSVPIGGVTRLQSVQILQALLGLVAIGTFLIAATLMERDSVEGRLRRRERLHSSLLDALSDLGEGFVVTDAGRLTYANDAYCRMTGYTIEELMELPSVLELSAPEEREALAARLRSRLAGDPVEDHYETTLIRKDRRSVACEVAVKLIPTEEGPRVVAIVRDVSERKRMQVFRDEFLAYAAHELRGPISTIRGFTELLTKREALHADDVDRAVQRIAANAETMGVRLERLMGLAQVQRGDLELRQGSVKIADVVRTATTEVATPPGKTLEVEVGDDLVVEADRHVAEQILANLLTNAYRYGGPHVRIVASRNSDQIQVAVIDDGPGVDPELVGRLFEPFVQGPTSKESGGAGLGLAMVKALGDLCDLETGYAPGGSAGARFYVSFPTASA